MFPVTTRAVMTTAPLGAQRLVSVLPLISTFRASLTAIAFHIEPKDVLSLITTFK